MALLRSGNNEDGDFVSDFLFCKCIREKIIMKHDSLTPEEIGVVRLLVVKIRSNALRIRTKCNSNSSAFRKLSNIINHMTLLLNEAVFKGHFPDNLLQHKNIIFHRNQDILQLYNIANTLCASINKLEHLFDSDCHKSYAMKWSDKDVLVGSLRNREQLDICLEHKFYHVPVSQIDKHQVPVKYVAIYQSKNLFGHYAGIYYWGSVIKTEIVKRNSITQIPSKSTDDYYRFTIGEWYRLDKSITANAGGMLFGFTNLYMLFRAKEIHQLYFDDYDEYKFYAAIFQAINEHFDHVVYNYKDSHVFIKSGYLMIYFDKKEYFRILLSDYVKNPGYHFMRIKKVYENIVK